MIDVLISEFIDNEAVSSLKKHLNVHYDPELWSKRKELINLVSNTKTLIVRNATQVDNNLLNYANQLQGVVRLGVGLDNINVDICRSKGIEVCPAIGANADSVAEYVIGMSIMLLRNNLFLSKFSVLEGKWDRKSYMNSKEIGGKILGIIGFGSIGQTVAEKANLMGMKVIGFDKNISENSSVWSKGEKVDFQTLLSNSDVISLHCPLLPETKNLISEKEFKKMKNNAILINAARGGIVNEKDCANALKNREILGAALDTLEIEPISSKAINLFSNLKNLILTPHIAGVTEDSNKRIAVFAVENIERILNK